MSAVIERIETLEQTVQDFVRNADIQFDKLRRSQLQTETKLRESHLRAEAEMGELRAELHASQLRTEVEMSELRMELQASQLRTEAGMRELQTELRESQKKLEESHQRTEKELREFKEEGRRRFREMNKKWGELSNKLGTLVEDLVAPSLPRIIEQRLDKHVYNLMVRVKRRLPDGRVKEFDALVVTPDCACLNSTKATLRSADVESFVADIAAFRTFYPEYDALPVVGILASLFVEESVLTYAEKQGFLVLAVGDELMEIKNRPGFEPKHW